MTFAVTNPNLDKSFFRHQKEFERENLHLYKCLGGEFISVVRIVLNLTPL